jgi:hypothetical protein
MVSGRQVAASIENAHSFAEVKKVTRWPNTTASEGLELYRWIARLGFAGVLVFVAFCLAARWIILGLRPKNAITYTGGPTVRAARGPTLLEISRKPPTRVVWRMSVEC